MFAYQPQGCDGFDCEITLESVPGTNGYWLIKDEDAMYLRAID